MCCQFVQLWELLFSLSKLGKPCHSSPILLPLAFLYRHKNRWKRRLTPYHWHASILLMIVTIGFDVAVESLGLTATLDLQVGDVARTHCSLFSVSELIKVVFLFGLVA